MTDQPDSQGSTGRTRMNREARERVLRELGGDRDETNPAFLFSMTATALLLAIADGLADPVVLARHELANRGLDQNGVWVGFQQAKQIHLNTNGE